ncbi:alpha/beta hydrolase family protein [Stakelama tenebrarum]|uniref:Alpha/beta hydrolase n=1 Tax=Stakelama tenebrarum TaxID=2711215 RepID=A0A6G6Y859_9SPHN|nr:alpha/beta fold hydrolase [Sphingosinithalassobacter tenebrarum]QIG81031.1 alpha/beta hydrolase [Sphingosinithalassobacter tenebrarum]
MQHSAAPHPFNFASWFRSARHFGWEVLLFLGGMVPPPRARGVLARIRRDRHARQRGRPSVRILLLPGLLASDRSMRKLRVRLRRAGHEAFGWRMGRNLGVGEDTFDRLDRRARTLAGGPDEKLVLIGWSLGGVIAREYAKRSPERVAAVITMGSPFAADIRSSFIWYFYRLVTCHRTVLDPDPERLAEKPPVPTVALWSPYDGLVPSIAARGRQPQVDGNVEVECAHMTYPTDDATIDAVLETVAAIGEGNLHCAVEPAPPPAESVPEPISQPAQAAA